jgi:hypothetical protein
LRIGQKKFGLDSAARTKQDAGQSQFGQQRAWQHFANQGDSLRPPRKHIGRIFIGAGGDNKNSSIP